MPLCGMGRWAWSELVGPPVGPYDECDRLVEGACQYFARTFCVRVDVMRRVGGVHVFAHEVPNVFGFDALLFPIFATA